MVLEKWLANFPIMFLVILAARSGAALIPILIFSFPFIFNKPSFITDDLVSLWMLAFFHAFLVFISFISFIVIIIIFIFNFIVTINLSIGIRSLPYFALVFTRCSN